jgi:hypothetical protein
MPIVVNGETIDDSEIRKEASLLRPQFERAMAHLDPIEAQMQLWEWSRENVIEKTLLRQEALKITEPVSEEEIQLAIQRMRPYQPGDRGCDPEAGSDSFKKDVEIQLRVDRLLAKVASEVQTVDKKLVSDYYRNGIPSGYPNPFTPPTLSSTSMTSRTRLLQRLELRRHNAD